MYDRAILPFGHLPKISHTVQISADKKGQIYDLLDALLKISHTVQISADKKGQTYDALLKNCASVNGLYVAS